MSLFLPYMQCSIVLDLSFPKGLFTTFLSTWKPHCFQWSHLRLVQLQAGSHVEATNPVVLCTTFSLTGYWPKDSG